MWMRLALLLTLSALGISAFVALLTVPAVLALPSPAPASASEMLEAVALAAAAGLLCWLWLLLAIESSTVLRDTGRRRRRSTGSATTSTTDGQVDGTDRWTPGRSLAKRIVALTLGASAAGLLGPAVASADGSLAPAGLLHVAGVTSTSHLLEGHPGWSITSGSELSSATPPTMPGGTASETSTASET
ncbi:MAG TPA: hypothetical protein PLA46_04195, partial [Phycicoccus sp.]|nr:hypothetical protein [Phycicoccus sp.]